MTYFKIIFPLTNYLDCKKIGIKLFRTIGLWIFYLYKFACQTFEGYKIQLKYNKIQTKFKKIKIRMIKQKV